MLLFCGNLLGRWCSPVNTSPCHGEVRGFESRPARHPTSPFGLRWGFPLSRGRRGMPLTKLHVVRHSRTMLGAKWGSQNTFLPGMCFVILHSICSMSTLFEARSTVVIITVTQNKLLRNASKNTMRVNHFIRANIVLGKSCGWVDSKTKSRHKISKYTSRHRLGTHSLENG